MKRLYISYILLAVSVTICITQFIYIFAICKTFINDIEKIEEVYTNKDYETAQTLCNNTTQKWQKKVKYTDIFLFHEYVDDITGNFAKLNICISLKEDTEVLSICSELKNQLFTLKNSEIPNAENII